MTTEANASTETVTTVVPAAGTTVVPDAPLTLLGDETAATPGLAAETVNKPAAASPEFEVIEYAKTGDAGLDMALGFVGARGIDDSDPAMQAAVNGDFSLIKAKLASLGDKAKGYEQYIALAEKSYKDTSEKATADAAKVKDMAYKIAGGEEQWKAINKWASENADPAEKTEVNAALRKGGVAAKAMLQYLVEAYSKASGTTVEPKAATKASAATQADASGGALSASDYVKEVQAARQKLGYGFDASPEYARLQQRREQGRKRGL